MIDVPPSLLAALTLAALFLGFALLGWWIGVALLVALVAAFVLGAELP